MREIKFRAWHRSAKQMLYENKLGDVFRWLGEGQPIDIIQYTGLKDRNGKEIYEGDKYQWQGYEVNNGKQIRPIRKGVIVWDFYELARIQNIIESNGTLEIIDNKGEKIK